MFGWLISQPQAVRTFSHCVQAAVRSLSSQTQTRSISQIPTCHDTSERATSHIGLPNSTGLLPAQLGSTPSAELWNSNSSKQRRACQDANCYVHSVHGINKYMRNYLECVGFWKIRAAHDILATKIRHFYILTVNHLKIITTYCQPARMAAICHV